MQIQINTDNNIHGSEDLAEHIRATVRKKMDHFADRITRVEVHLGDENSHKVGPRDQRCMMEARPTGLKPLAVTHMDASMHQAVEGAAEKLHHLVRNQLGKLADKR